MTSRSAWFSATRFMLTCLGLALGSAAVAWAEGDATRAGDAKAAASDRDLLSDLNNDLLRDAAPGGADNRPADGALQGGEDLGQGPENPLARVSQRMRTVEQLIDQANDDERAKDEQRQIVADLDKLLEQLQKQCQGGKSGSCDKPGQGSKPGSSGKSGAGNVGSRQTPQPSKNAGKKGPQNAQANGQTQKSKNSSEVNKSKQGDGAASADLVDLEGLLKDAWGNLPEREREQMLQAPPEHFLPKYELLIEQYYKRLAESQRRGI